jgi:uncharacterized DUF497 family protein
MDIPENLGISDFEFRLVFGRTKIDYAPNKEEANRKNHGYSLESAGHLLERVLLPVCNLAPYAVSEPFMENDEVRHMHMSVNDSGRVVLMVTTMRHNETVRVISCRRAHTNEEPPTSKT